MNLAVVIAFVRLLGFELEQFEGGQAHGHAGAALCVSAQTGHRHTRMLTSGTPSIPSSGPSALRRLP